MTSIRSIIFNALFYSWTAICALAGLMTFMVPVRRRFGPAKAWSRGVQSVLLSQGRPARARSDIEIQPDMRGITSMWPWQIRTSMRRGETAARKALPSIRRLLAARVV